MKYLKIKSFTLFFAAVCLMLISCNSTTEVAEAPLAKPITKKDIIAFQKAYGTSFNSVSKTMDDDGYYESTARKHIKSYYNFDEGKVMFKVANEDETNYRYDSEGLLSYLIGKNDKYPEDEGIATENWRKIDWITNGILIESGIAIVMGQTKLINDKKEIVQNYTMNLKRNKAGELKIIMHKISKPCDA